MWCLVVLLSHCIVSLCGVTASSLTVCCRGISVYYPRRRLWESDKKASVMVSGELLGYVTTMLRVDPCFRVRICRRMPPRSSRR